MADEHPSLRASLGAPARRIVAGATDRRFDAVESGLARLGTQLEEMEQRLVRNELEVAALRQQMEEALAFLRLQHDIVRDLLEELRPVLATRRPSS
jgi:uncharacterized protein YhaN